MLILLIIIIVGGIIFYKRFLPKLEDKAIERIFDESEGITKGMREQKNAEAEIISQNANQKFNPEYIPKDADKLAAKRAAVRKAESQK